MRKSAWALFFLLPSGLLFSQDRPPRPTQPSIPPVRPILANELYIPYWTLEPGWHTGIEIRNNFKASTLTVTPAIRTSAGAEIALPRVTVKPDEVIMVDLHEELAKVAPQLIGQSGAIGSAVLRFDSQSLKNIYAGSMVHYLGKPIAYHFDAMHQGKVFNGETTRESIWWLPTPTADGHLIITNASAKPSVMSVALFDDSGRASESRVSLGPRQTRRISIREAVITAGFKSISGGLRVAVEKGSESVYAAQVVFDETSGFSALMRMFERDPGREVQAITLRAPMMALSNPDPALFLPEGTVLKPKIFMRNASEGVLKVSASLRWRTEGENASVSLGTIELAAGASRTLDLAKLQESGEVPQSASWAAVTLSYQGRYGDLVSIAASYEAEGRYGLQTPFSKIVASSWVGSRWYADPIRNSIITVGNATNDSTVANLTLHYDRGRKAYEIEQRLGPGEQIWVDVSKLIRNQVPDKNGKFIPLEVEHGAYSISDKTHVFGPTLFEGKLTIDKKFGHATYGCASCCNPGSPWLEPNVYNGLVGDLWQSAIKATMNCTGGTVDITAEAYGWDSSNFNVAENWGSGYYYAAGVGEASVSTYIDVRDIPDYWWECPYYQVPLSAGVTIRPVITGANTVWWFNFNGQSPNATTWPAQITLTATAGSTPTWNVIANPSWISLNSSGRQATIVATGAHLSETVEDVKVTVTVGGVTSLPFGITVKAPARVVLPQGYGGELKSCSADSQPGQGWVRYKTWLLWDNFNQSLPNMGVNEGLSGNTVWPAFPSTGGVTDSSGVFTDKIFVCADPGGLNPMPQDPNLGSPSTVLVDSIPQSWCAGSSVDNLWNVGCYGAPIQSDTIKRFLDHGQITIP